MAWKSICVIDISDLRFWFKHFFLHFTHGEGVFGVLVAETVLAP